MKEELLIQYFYEGLLPIERQMLDASAGGALVDMTPVAAKTLIANRAHNAQQYEGVGQREDPRQHSVNEVNAISEIQSQLANLTSLVSQVVIGSKPQENQVCTVCSIQGHPSEKCPKLIENGGWESANAIRFQGQNQTRYDPYSNTYNPGWRDHPTVDKTPTFELKLLPDHLKYVFLGDDETLPVIVSSSLTTHEEEKLVRVLREHKTAMGWTLADNRGMSPTTCMHRILLEEGTKPSREAQRRLNPPMMEVVKKEIIKLLDCGVIYPISDSHWVSPVQVVLKKSGVIVVKNDENELVPTRIQIG
ncbi:hypothetical protein PS2_030064 [Malus domestica]